MKQVRREINIEGGEGAKWLREQARLEKKRATRKAAMYERVVRPTPIRRFIRKIKGLLAIWRAL